MNNQPGTKLAESLILTDCMSAFKITKTLKRRLTWGACFTEINKPGFQEETKTDDASESVYKFFWHNLRNKDKKILVCIITIDLEIFNNT